MKLVLRKLLPSLPLVWALLLFAVLGVLGLGSCTNFEGWGHDAPHIRELQKESLAGVSARPIAGESIEDFFRDKVGLIVTSNRTMPSGRAVPISRDGYYLTAWHVVDEGEFFLSDFVQLKRLPEGVAFKPEDYYRVDRHLGRIVWRDENADLAIVKFDFRPQHLFPLANYPLKKGAKVFSGAFGTNSGTLVISERLGDGVGNGPYQTAGEILKVEPKRGAPSSTLYHSTLVARGGMSGGPVVGKSGHLVGIIIKLQPGFLSGPTTLFSMMPAEDVQEVIRQDRGARE